MTTVRGYATSANMTTASEITLYDPEGNTVTVGSDERLEVTSCWATSVVTTKTVRFFSDADAGNDADASEIFYACGLGNGFSDMSAGMAFPRGVPLHAGAAPHAIADASGTTSVGLTGVIRRVE